MHLEEELVHRRRQFQSDHVFVRDGQAKLLVNDLPVDALLMNDYRHPGFLGISIAKGEVAANRDPSDRALLPRHDLVGVDTDPVQGGHLAELCSSDRQVCLQAFPPFVGVGSDEAQSRVTRQRNDVVVEVHKPRRHPPLSELDELGCRLHQPRVPTLPRGCAILVSPDSLSGAGRTPSMKIHGDDGGSDEDDPGLSGRTIGPVGCVYPFR